MPIRPFQIFAYLIQSNSIQLLCIIIKEITSDNFKNAKKKNNEILKRIKPMKIVSKYRRKNSKNVWWHAFEAKYRKRCILTKTLAHNRKNTPIYCRFLDFFFTEYVHHIIRYSEYVGSHDIRQ